MTTWVEEPHDNGSAVWGCTTCEQGGWCNTHAAALSEANQHAKHHRDKVTVLGKKRGPQPDHARDQRITELRAQNLTMRAIANTLGISAPGVAKALNRRRRA